jgi:hypothetical protein
LEVPRCQTEGISRRRIGLFNKLQDRPLQFLAQHRTLG